ncbi:oligosaccharide reducing-end xylanase [Butyrivibrio hungatei]|uniref:Oligosaccharide reducing-end xylanase n=1 Tax=Butyrivibrio hungatei TaxID=185008 RepID=A0A1G5B8K0_9FIRM|nr:glycosyl hydrolase family 8 [Butyrivibrio hungatei]SCX86515.1 oligosaccharide reducing-end xylanase [Butyrivibrio hungatei]
MAAYNDKKYRNVFSEIGKSDAEIEKKIKDAVDTFFYGSDDERIYHPVGDDMGYFEDTGNHDARTEGMSYGMMMCVQLDMKEEFDRIWKWSKTYMFMDEGENEGYFAWSCNVDGSRNSDGPAPDGEEFYAMALFFASHRWGDGEGIFNYSAEAKEILRACVHKGENGRAGAPMWNRDNHLVLFVPGHPFSDPSYHLPHFYELFAEWAYEEDKEFWQTAAKESRKYLVKTCHPVTGLNPEYGNFDGSPVNDPMPWDGSVHGRFFSDAYRTAANIGLDAEWFGKDEGQISVPLKMMKFFGTDIEAMRCVYEIDGTSLELPVLHPVGLLATMAQSALSVPYSKESGSDFEIASKWVEWFWNQPLRQGKRRYYDNCLYLFALLALSGNYRIW